MIKEESNIKNEDVQNNIDLNKLDSNELINRIIELTKNQNPYNVSKEIENIKSVFYQKIHKHTDSSQNSIINKDLKNQELDPIEIKFKEVFKQYQNIKSVFRKEQYKKEKENLKIKQTIINDIDKLSQEEESLKKTFKEFRILQEKWRNTGYVPIQERNNIWQSYQHHIELFYDFIKLNKDLRDLDFKKNLEEKLEICKKAEQLQKEKSLNKIHENLQKLHENWKNIGPVKKVLREDLWDRFQKISKKLNKKRNDYFLTKKEEGKKKLSNKNKICDEISALTKQEPQSHKEWQEITKKFKNLELKWKEIGRLNKINNKITWQEFRNVSTKFFNKKNDFYKKQKEQNKNSLQIKIKICEKAEKLQNNTDWKKTTNEFIKLQKQWKSSGYSGKSQIEKIWVRFKKASDAFFNAKKQQLTIIMKNQKDNLKQKEQLLKELEVTSLPDDKDTAKQKLKIISKKWNSIGPIPKEKTKINTTFLSLINTKYEKIGLNLIDLELEKYQNKVNTLKRNKEEKANERQTLNTEIELINQNIYQYENNISFLGKNKNTEPLVKQVLKKIEILNQKIETIKKKLTILNKG